MRYSTVRQYIGSFGKKQQILKYSNDNSELCKSSNNFLDSYRILLTGMSTNFLPDNIFYKIKSISDYYSKV